MGVTIHDIAKEAGGRAPEKTVILPHICLCGSDAISPDHRASFLKRTFLWLNRMKSTFAFYRHGPMPRCSSRGTGRSKCRICLAHTAQQKNAANVYGTLRLIAILINSEKQRKSFVK